MNFFIHSVQRRNRIYMKCLSKTIKNLPCKNNPLSGSQFCRVHTSKTTVKTSTYTNRTQDVINILEFLPEASYNMTHLAQMRSQFCLKTIPSAIKQKMDHLEDRLQRIVHGHSVNGKKKIAGIKDMIDSVDKRKALESLKGKFQTTVAELKDIMMKNCKIKDGD